MASLPIGFTHPWYLLLLLVLPVFYWLAVRRAAGARTGQTLGRRAPRGPWPISLVLRLGVAGCVVLALAGLRAPAPVKHVDTVFVVDLSASVPADIREGAKNWVRQALAEMGPDDRAGIVTFGSEARVERPLDRADDHPVWGEPPPGAGTNIRAALELAAELLPPWRSESLRRIVLLTDGNETAGEAQRALLRPALRDVEVAVLSLPQRLQDTAISSLSVPPALRRGESAEVRVGVLSPTSQAGVLRVFLLGGSAEHLVAERPVRLEAGPHEFVVTTGDLPEGGWAIRAEIEVEVDSQAQNNVSWAHTVVGAPGRVLLVEGAPGEAAALQQALTGAQIEVETVSPDRLATGVEALERYDTVVLVNVSAGALRPEQMEALRRNVAERGGGLVAIGGERAFGLGDYAETPLEQALPVTVNPPDRDQVASLALVLVIDRSGSMETPGVSRMELAKEGAIQAVETLQDGDQIGVLAFDSSARWVADIRPVRGPADIRDVTDRISTIRVEGGTDIMNALDTAYRGLQQVQARVKHVVLLTDGENAGAPVPPLVAAMRRAGITVSTVGIASEEGRPLLQQIARLGQGRHYFTDAPRDIPRIMTQEARLAARSYKQERDFTPRLSTAAPAVRGLVPADFPQLHGYVRAAPRPAAETVLTSDVGEPILVQWQYGLGRALVWTSDAGAAWARSWADSDAFRRLWTQAVRWTMAAPVDPTFQVSVRQEGLEAVVRVEATEPTGEFRNLHPTYADVALPDGGARRVTLPQVAPGRYEGRFALARPGVYFVQATQERPDGAVVATQLTGVALPHLPEYQLNAANRALLERLAADTGGPALNRPEESWRRDTRQGWQPQEVWPALLAAALVLLVLDVGVRRLRPTPADAAAAAAAGRRALGAALGRRPGLPVFRLHPLQAGSRRRR